MSIRDQSFIDKWCPCRCKNQNGDYMEGYYCNTVCDCSLIARPDEKESIEEDEETPYGWKPERCYWPLHNHRIKEVTRPKRMIDKYGKKERLL